MDKDYNEGSGRKRSWVKPAFSRLEAAHAEISTRETGVDGEFTTSS